MDYNKIAKYEKAIKEKYGEEAIKNPKGDWDQEKEKAYLKDLKQFHSKKERAKITKKEEGFDLVIKSVNDEKTRTCPVCKVYSMKSVDDLYMVKFECCFDCYIQYVEDREERWKTGWRPNK